MAPELVRCPTQPGLLRYAGANSDQGSLQSAGSAGSTASSSSMTPQQQQHQQAMRRYDARKVDAWALGVLLYVLVCAQYPFSVSGKTQARKAIYHLFASVCRLRMIIVVRASCNVYALRCRCSSTLLHKCELLWCGVEAAWQVLMLQTPTRRFWNEPLNCKTATSSANNGFNRLLSLQSAVLPCCRAAARGHDLLLPTPCSLCSCRTAQCLPLQSTVSGVYVVMLRSCSTHRYAIILSVVAG
jgi:hypothetical protein